MARGFSQQYARAAVMAIAVRSLRLVPHAEDSDEAEASADDHEDQLHERAIAACAPTTASDDPPTQDSIRTGDRQVHRPDAHGSIGLHVSLVVLVTGHLFEQPAVLFKPMKVPAPIRRRSLPILKSCMRNQNNDRFRSIFHDETHNP